MSDRSCSDASIKPKEECANSREDGKAKRVQRLTHIGNVKLDVFGILTCTLSKRLQQVLIHRRWDRTWEARGDRLAFHLAL